MHHSLRKCYLMGHPKYIFKSWKRNSFCQVNKAVSTTSCIQLPQKNKKERSKLIEIIIFSVGNSRSQTELYPTLKGSSQLTFFWEWLLLVVRASLIWIRSFGICWTKIVTWIQSGYLVSVHKFHFCLGQEEAIL